MIKKVLSFTLALTAAAVAVQAQAARPNILVIFGDDIGITNIATPFTPCPRKTSSGNTCRALSSFRLARSPEASPSTRPSKH
jgi:hypothetical protein